MVSRAELVAFERRETFFGVLEALPALLVPMWDPSALENSDIIWFVDNQGAAASLAKGSSGAPDIDRIVALSHLLWARFRARVWIEWVDSKANISDGISRDGAEDETARKLGLNPIQFQLPRCSELLQHDFGCAVSFAMSSIGQ